MKIAFLCSSLEPGRDGVGDYTRRLAGELIRQGHPCILTGLNDALISDAVTGSQEVEQTQVPALRLPDSMPWLERARRAREWLCGFGPDWYSLQFVPFGFHRKGLSLGLGRKLSSIMGWGPLQWMFHELWVLWSFPLSLQKRLLGQCQKHCLRSSLRKLKPRIVTTQLPIYRTELSRIGVAADLLPLHGNVPVYPKLTARDWLRDKCKALTCTSAVKAGFFGNILPTLAPAVLASQIARFKVPRGRLYVFSAGTLSGESTRRWHALEHDLRDVATFLSLGGLKEREVSFYFSALDCGLTSYPPELMGKSGAVAAMREHGLKVISCGSLSRRRGASHSQVLDASIPWTVAQSAGLLLERLRSVVRSDMVGHAPTRRSYN